MPFGESISNLNYLINIAKNNAIFYNFGQNSHTSQQEKKKIF